MCSSLKWYLQTQISPPAFFDDVYSYILFFETDCR